MREPIFIVLIGAAAAFPAQAAEPYRAQGTDPEWSLTIADGRMSYDAPLEPPVSVATPAADTEAGVVTYTTARLSLSVMPLACTDRASGRRYADSVFVTIDRKERHGCGGALLPADSLNGTSWHLAEIAGEPVGLTGDLFRDDIYAVDFHADSFVGYGGCNRFSAAYSRAGDILTTQPPIGRGIRRCREPVMGREGRLLQILDAPVRVSFPDADTMILAGDAGTIKLLRAQVED